MTRQDLLEKLFVLARKKKADYMLEAAPLLQDFMRSRGGTYSSCLHQWTPTSYGAQCIHCGTEYYAE